MACRFRHLNCRFLNAVKKRQSKRLFNRINEPSKLIKEILYGKTMTKPADFEFLMSKGDVYFNIQGATPEDAISSFIKIIRLPKAVNRDLFKVALIEREHLGSTAIGEGFAIPHSRKTIAADRISSFASIGYLAAPIDWSASDGKPVTTIFIILTDEVQEHLSVLSSIACLAGKTEFQKFIAKHPAKEEVLEFIKNSGC